MKIKLKNLAEIQTGYPFRKTIQSCNEQSAVAVIQMGDLNDALSPDMSHLVKTEISGLKSGHFLQKNDVLFRARGTVPYGYYLRELFCPCVAAAPLQRIRITTNALLPEYLAWYSRQFNAQSYFELNAQGSSLRMVGLDVLENWVIPVIPVERQARIVELSELSEREQTLTQQVLHLKSLLLDKILNRWIGE